MLSSTFAQALGNNSAIRVIINPWFHLVSVDFAHKMLVQRLCTSLPCPARSAGIFPVLSRPALPAEHFPRSFRGRRVRPGATGAFRRAHAGIFRRCRHGQPRAAPAILRRGRFRRRRDSLAAAAGDGGAFHPAFARRLAAQRSRRDGVDARHRRRAHRRHRRPPRGEGQPRGAHEIGHASPGHRRRAQRHRNHAAPARRHPGERCRPPLDLCRPRHPARRPFPRRPEGHRDQGFQRQKGKAHAAGQVRRDPEIHRLALVALSQRIDAVLPPPVLFAGGPARRGRGRITRRRTAACGSRRRSRASFTRSCRAARW